MLKKIGKHFLNLLYPPLCLHCDDVLENDELPLCTACTSLLELIDPLDRCPKCFSSDYCRIKKLCGKCIKKRSFIKSSAQCFEYRGPAKTLSDHLKTGSMPHLAKGLSGYLALQFLQLNWEKPDFIIPVPIPTHHKVERGYSHNELLAKELALLLNSPMINALERVNSYDGHLFRAKKGVTFEEKMLLLIDEDVTSQMTLQRSSEALIPTFPRAIYALSLCRSNPFFMTEKKHHT